MSLFQSESRRFESDRPLHLKWTYLKNQSFLFLLTNIIYESPKRAKRTLQLIKDKYPSAKVVVASELTKIHEKIQDWDLEFGKWGLQLGELVILVNFSRSSPTPDVVP